jgi:hypothetical protein
MLAIVTPAETTDRKLAAMQNEIRELEFASLSAIDQMEREVIKKKLQFLQWKQEILTVTYASKYRRSAN